MDNKLVLKVSEEARYSYYADFMRAIIFGIEILHENEAGCPELKIEYVMTEDKNLLVEVVFSGLAGAPVGSKMLFSPDDLFIYDPESHESAVTKAVKLVMINVLSQVCGRAFAWGTLTGVRPTKVVHKLIWRGFAQDDIIAILERLYRLNSRKANLITNLAQLAQAHKSQEIDSAAIYVAVPYCPSKCSYCSFPSYLMKNGSTDKYFEALLQEIDVVSHATKRFTVDSVYIGGGTPAVLTPEQVRRLFTALHSSFRLQSNCEITFEAGRSELVSSELLQACFEAGVNRVSVNPQTIHEKTLQKISRPGGIQDVDRAVDIVRASGIPMLNMDLIAGLPGEDLDDYNKSLEYILSKRPENITVHALALKRASKFVSEGMSLDCPGEDKVSSMFELTGERLAASGYTPYYMYRQKHMPGDQENMGYCLAGCESIYNINMIEDWQTIIGLGAGAATKLLRSDGRLLRSYNPKDPIMYMNELMQRMDARLQLFSVDNERR